MGLESSDGSGQLACQRKQGGKCQTRPPRSAVSLGARSPRACVCFLLVINIYLLALGSSTLSSVPQGLEVCKLHFLDLLKAVFSVGGTGSRLDGIRKKGETAHPPLNSDGMSGRGS